MGSAAWEVFFLTAGGEFGSLPMNDNLVTLTTELKHANEHLARHEQKIDGIR